MTLKQSSVPPVFKNWPITGRLLAAPKIALSFSRLGQKICGEPLFGPAALTKIRNEIRRSASPSMAKQ
jgi:hypothetical protein